ncbi:amino acid ABC transporter permease [Sinorhizobium medicae]|nr:amino acid ABC transporter permease [Sinorhizobium medicae]
MTTQHCGSGAVAAMPTSLPRLDIAEAVRVRRFRPLRLLLGALAIAFAIFVFKAFVDAQIDWSVVGEYLLARITIVGLGFTILMTVVAMLIGLSVAVLLAVGFGSHNPVIRWICKTYVWLFRGTPQLLQLLLWYNLALVFPVAGFPGLGSWQTVDLMGPFAAAAIGLGLNAGAYMSEIIRSGLLSVDAGQYEAAKAIGMTRGKALRKVIFPQAMRVIIPPLGNEFIGMTKNTSLASIVGFGELIFVMQSIYFYNFKVIEMLLVSAFWYLIVTSILSVGQYQLEKRFGRGFGRGGRL